MAVRLDTSRWFICDLEKERRLDYIRRNPNCWSFRELMSIFSEWTPEKCTGYHRRLEWEVRVAPCESCKRERGLK